MWCHCLQPLGWTPDQWPMSLAKVDRGFATGLGRSRRGAGAAFCRRCFGCFGFGPSHGSSRLRFEAPQRHGGGSLDGLRNGFAALCSPFWIHARTAAGLAMAEMRRRPRPATDLPPATRKRGTGLRRGRFSVGWMSAAPCSESPTMFTSCTSAEASSAPTTSAEPSHSPTPKTSTSSSASAATSSAVPAATLVPSANRTHKAVTGVSASVGTAQPEAGGGKPTPSAKHHAVAPPTSGPNHQPSSSRRRPLAK
mmetsp:Transcript_29458/g.83954  ORF Transcript_29458/g.83954 Transcript_29458/m.83954 type:complete len:252 (+) Transcript_29458:176-931(+)